MRGVAAFGDFAQAVAFYGFRENDGRLAGGFGGFLVGVENLLRIVAATAQIPDVVVGQVLDQLQQLGIFAEKFFPDKCAVVGAETLIFAVDAFVHALDQEAGGIAGEKIVPAGAPDQLDHVPAGAAEGRFQLLNDAAVAADRAVQALQVAIDDKDQVVELLAGSKSQRAERFGLIAFSVAQEGPNFAWRRGDES